MLAGECATMTDVHRHGCGCIEQRLTQGLAVGIGKVNVGYAVQRALKKSLLAPVGVVNDLVRNDQIPGFEVGADATHGRDRNDRLGATLGQGPDVGTVIDFVRRNRVSVAVPGQEGDRTPAQQTEGHCPRRVAVGRAQHFAPGHAEVGQLGQARAADHRKHIDSKMEFRRKRKKRRTDGKAARR